MLFSFLSLSFSFGYKEKFNIDIKNAEFDADYELVEKISKKFMQKKVFNKKRVKMESFPFTTASKSVRPTPTMGVNIFALF